MSTETQLAGQGPEFPEGTGPGPRILWVRHRQSGSWWGYAGPLRLVSVQWRARVAPGEYHWAVVSHLPMDVPPELIGSNLESMAKACAEKFVQRFLTRIKAQWRQGT